MTKEEKDALNHKVLPKRVITDFATFDTAGVKKIPEM